MTPPNPSRDVHQHKVRRRPGQQPAEGDRNSLGLFSLIETPSIHFPLHQQMRLNPGRRTSSPLTGFILISKFDAELLSQCSSTPSSAARRACKELMRQTATADVSLPWRQHRLSVPVRTAAEGREGGRGEVEIVHDGRKAGEAPFSRSRARLGGRAVFLGYG